MELGGIYMNFKITDDKTKLDAVLSMPQKKDRPVPLCIIIHGFTGNKEERHLLAICDMMNEIGMATLRVDMYGHGLSEGEFRNHTLYKWFSNAIAVIDYVRKMPEISRIYLAGHSQGGLTAIMVGAMERDRISGLLPLSPALNIPEDTRSGSILGHYVDLDDIKDEYETDKPDYILGGNYIRVAQSVFPEEAMKAYEGEVLIVHGEDDRSVPIECVRDKVSHYKNCRFVSIPDETHCYDNHLDVVVKTIKDYILEKKWNE